MTISLPSVTAVVVSPNPASINQLLSISITVIEIEKILEPEIIYSGEIYSGEVW
jgi:hypothetical protein